MSLSFDPEALKALAELLEKTGLTELELAEGDRKIRLLRGRNMEEIVSYALPRAEQQARPFTAQPAELVEEVKRDDPAKHPGVVKSPMVGVVYLAPEPDATPYVVMGQQVEAGATIMLIEAMKTFNQIKAPRAGTVTRILVTAGAPVEYDEPLLVIE